MQNIIQQLVTQVTVYYYGQDSRMSNMKKCSAFPNYDAVMVEFLVRNLSYHGNCDVECSKFLSSLDCVCVFTFCVIYS